MPDFKLKRQILKAAAFMLFLSAALFIYIAYLGVWEGEALESHPLNQRGAAARADIARGRILASGGEVLAEGAGARSYPFGEAAVSITGYMGTRTGGAGLEARRNRELLGLTQDMTRLGPLSQLLQNDQGNDVQTTIDVRAQEAAYEGLAGRRGAAVVLDARTGAVLAMVSTPAYDPNSAEANWEALLADEETPLLNRAVQGMYPPGSSIKPVVLAAALKAALPESEESFLCEGGLTLGGGERISDYHGEVHGRVTPEEALALSCNSYFGTLGLRLGESRLLSGFSDFGLDRELNGDLLLAAGHYPELSKLGDGDLAQTAIGQSALLVTPMHMALAASAFINGGVIMRPYLVESIISPEGRTLEKARSEKLMQAATPEIAAKVLGYMETVVNSGTGTAARVAGVSVAGKTGTAENPAGADHAWFIGTARLKDRDIAFAIIIENGGSGGRDAAPVARSIIESLL